MSDSMSDTSSFSIHNRREVIHNLSILVKNKCLVTVRFGEGRAFFLTAILEIDETENILIFDYGPKESLNEQLLKSRRIIFEADFAGIKSSFRSNTPNEILYQGEPAFCIPIPESIFWMQRRQFFRIKSPRAKGSYCQFGLDEQRKVNLLLYDISLTGFSMLNTSTEVSDFLVDGEEINNCKLVLSGVGEGTISVKICAKLIINPNKIDALKIQKIGCLFTQITPQFETTVQRYINQLQREIIRKLRGERT